MTFSVDVFWSYRSPYCYLTLDRFRDWQQTYDLRVEVRPVYPMAVRNPDFFATINRKYRPYHTNDYNRVAEMLGMPIRKPVPDPIVMDNEKYEISPDQPFISRLTRTGAAAQKRGKCFEFTDAVMRLIWDGRTDGWNTDAYYAAVIAKAGLDADEVMAEVEDQPDMLEQVIADNQAAFDDAMHWGVPCMVFDGETFYGQDRLDVLLWRMMQKGLTDRP
jgi:2-hydroxychromene-2-carboxylate isomerase